MNQNHQSFTLHMQDFKEAVTKKDLCKQIASLDKSRKQYQVVSIKVDNESKKTD
jgi:hypothetical protein